MSRLGFFIYIIIFVLFSSCESSKSKKEITNEKFSFYYWKNRLKYSKEIEEILISMKISKIYLHYFDVDVVKYNADNENFIEYDENEEIEETNNMNFEKGESFEEETEFSDDYKSYPTYVVIEIDKFFKKFKIVPVVFITNRAIKITNPKILAKNIKSLVDEISLYHFKKIIDEIQLDCDWTEETKNSYFKLIELLKQDFKVDVTIRLHQIKFKNKTGIPPVERGTLMLYNVAKIGSIDYNSILDSRIVNQYIDKNTDYPIKLNVALPVFTQLVIINNKGDVKLLNNPDIESIVNNHKCFSVLKDNLYKVNIDTLFKSYYLYKDYKIKIEKVSEKEIIECCKILKKSKLKIKNFIFYHLDESVKNNYNIKKLMENL